MNGKVNLYRLIESFLPNLVLTKRKNRVIHAGTSIFTGICTKDELWYQQQNASTFISN